MRAASNSICNRDAFSGGSGCAPIITMMYAQTEYRTARSEEILRLPWNINTLVPVQSQLPSRPNPSYSGVILITVTVLLLSFAT